MYILCICNSTAHSTYIVNSLPMFYSLHSTESRYTHSLSPPSSLLASPRLSSPSSGSFLSRIGNHDHDPSPHAVPARARPTPPDPPSLVGRAPVEAVRGGVLPSGSSTAMLASAMDAGCIAYAQRVWRAPYIRSPSLRLRRRRAVHLTAHDSSIPSCAANSSHSPDPATTHTT